MTRAAETRYPRLLVAGMMFVAFATGIAALLYQVIWQRMLVLYTGSDVQSAALVISAYLAGLGVGSWAGLRMADRCSARRALQFYGLANALVALFAVISPWLLHHVFYLRSLGMDHGALWMWLEIFVALVVPTALMGISLPVVSRALAFRLDAIPHLVSSLNGLNTVGAAVGCLAGAWWFAPAIGFERSLHIGACISLCAGVLVLAMAALSSDQSPVPPPVDTRQPVTAADWRTRRWAILFFLSGFLAISLQMVWLRIAVVTTGQSPVVYAVILAFILFFDGLGSLLASRWRMAAPWRVFLLLQVLIVGWSVFAVWFLPPLVFGLPFPWSHLLSVMLLVPAALLVGATFPVVHRAVHDDLGKVGERVGLLDVANIAGNVLAGVVTGLLLLEWWGSAGVYRVVIALGSVFAALFVLDLLREQSRARRLAALCGVAVVALVPGWRFPGEHDFWQALHRQTAAGTGFLVQEKSSGVSAFLQFADGRTEMQVNGHYQGEIPLGRTGQLYLGMLPALLHPDPRSALLVGLGSGATAYGIGTRESVETVTVVELVSAQYPLHRALLDSDPDPALAALFADPRYRWVDGDGRRWLASQAERYDIIEADAVMPTTSGAGFLYSREFFELVRSRLKPGGLMAQWSPTPRTERTFVAVFPYVVKFKGDLLVGSNEPITVDTARLQALLGNPSLQQRLAKAGLGDAFRNSVLDKLVQQRWTPADKPLLADLNSDWWPKDEFAVPE